MRHTIAALLALCLAGSAFAQQAPKRAPASKPPAAKEWALEPKTVLGLTFGEELPAGALLKCYEYNASTQSALGFCTNDPSPGGGSILLDGFVIPQFKSGMLSRSNGRVVGLFIEAQQEDFGAVRDLLVKRYGPPTTHERQTVQNRMGAEFSSEKLVWIGKKLALSATERSGQIDKTIVQFSDIGHLNRKAAEAAQKTTDSAGKL